MVHEWFNLYLLFRRSYLFFKLKGHHPLELCVFLNLESYWLKDLES
jgi:hypothetical protein